MIPICRSSARPAAFRVWCGWSRRIGGCRRRRCAASSPTRPRRCCSIIRSIPAAVVYPREDLELLARFCQEFDTIAICDEVWEHVIFDGREHIPLITIPGMRDRTIKVGSAGKIFSLTGWKIGFVCAAPPLLRVAAKVHQFLTFTTAPNLQAAVAYGLGKPEEYFLPDAQGSRAQPRPADQRAGKPRLSGAALAGNVFLHRRPVAARFEFLE